MIPNSTKLADYLHYFFACYLPQHKDVSRHTLLSYRQTFLHLLRYWNTRFPQDPHPHLESFQVDLLLDFLGWLEKYAPEFLDAPTLEDKDKQKFYYQHFREHIDAQRARG